MSGVVDLVVEAGKVILPFYIAPGVVGGLILLLSVRLFPRDDLSLWAAVPFLGPGGLMISTLDICLRVMRWLLGKASSGKCR